MPLTAKVNKLGVQITDKQGKVHTGKGTLSVHGLGQFPITLYANQWLEILDPGVVAGIRKLCEQGLKDGTLAGARTKSATGERINLAAFGQGK